MAAGSRTSARSKRRLKIWMPRTKTFSDVSSKAKSRGSRALSGKRDHQPKLQNEQHHQSAGRRCAASEIGKGEMRDLQKSRGAHPLCHGKSKSKRQVFCVAVLHRRRHCAAAENGRSGRRVLAFKSFAVTSEGVEYSNPKYLRKSEAKLAKLQRRLSRKTKGSRRCDKARLAVARMHEHIANQRLDMQHKLSTALVRENDVICIEDLAPSNMVKNHTLAKSVSDAAWGEFRRQLQYKADWYGKTVSVVDRFFPVPASWCSSCGEQWHGTKDLSVREWVCPKCSAHHDRDVNAAKNILNEGLRLLAEQPAA